MRLPVMLRGSRGRPRCPDILGMLTSRITKSGFTCVELLHGVRAVADRVHHEARAGERGLGEQQVRRVVVGHQDRRRASRRWFIGVLSVPVPRRVSALERCFQIGVVCLEAAGRLARRLEVALLARRRLAALELLGEPASAEVADRRLERVCGLARPPRDRPSRAPRRAAATSSGAPANSSVAEVLEAPSACRGRGSRRPGPRRAPAKQSRQGRRTGPRACRGRPCPRAAGCRRRPAARPAAAAAAGSGWRCRRAPGHAGSGSTAGATAGAERRGDERPALLGDRLQDREQLVVRERLGEEVVHAGLDAARRGPARARWRSARRSSSAACRARSPRGGSRRWRRSRPCPASGSPSGSRRTCACAPGATAARPSSATITRHAEFARASRSATSRLMALSSTTSTSRPSDGMPVGLRAAARSAFADRPRGRGLARRRATPAARSRSSCWRTGLAMQTSGCDRARALVGADRSRTRSAAPRRCPASAGSSRIVRSSSSVVASGRRGRAARRRTACRAWRRRCSLSPSRRPLVEHRHLAPTSSASVSSSSM